ncbi:MAG: DUF3048 domain-containing protein [Chloroflexi bacterium]|nr:DUF3048 domain-containing protein [Chloroflexota bacterium]
MKQQLIILTILAALFVLTACGEASEPTPIPPMPTMLVDDGAVTNATPATATSASLSAGISQAANPTPLPPPPTMAPPPTMTPLPASPTPEAVLLLSPEDFGGNRNPLTGEVVADPSVLARRPYTVKISNAPPSYVRPQSGLNDADIIYEHLAEGSITRFTAIFYGKTPPKIGPIRSARLIDVELPAMYDAALFFSGASVGVNQRLNGSDFSGRLMRSAEDGYYRTGEDKPFEHTLYGEPEGFYRALEARGLNTPPNFVGTLAFGSAAPDGGEPAGQVAIDYRWEIVEWQYDARDGRYYRWAAGAPILDANTNEQVNAANVIIISPLHVEDPTICEEIRDNQCVALSVQIQIWGSGSGIILRDGQQYPVNWHREGRNDLLTFTDANGALFPLQIGNSWVQLIPSWYTDPVSITP